MRLSHPLGAWIHFDSDKWSWYMNKEKTYLYQCLGNKWKTFMRSTRSYQSNRFSEEGIYCIPPQQHYILPTTLARNHWFYIANNTSQIIISPLTPTPSLQKLLKPELIPWLFHGVQCSESIQTLLHDIQSGLSISASDGSYHPDSRITAAAWIIESVDGK